MKIIVNAWSIKSFKAMVDLKVEKIRIGIKDYSLRFNNYITLSDLKELIKIKMNSKISISINRFFDESELELLNSLVKELAKLKVDEICFADLAVAQIVYENNLNVNLHYQPETIITNYEQLWFFQKNNINSFTISNGLMQNEITEMIYRKNKSNLEMQFFGQTFFMYSKWKLVSNFRKHLKKNGEKLPFKKFYIIQEDERDIPNFIYEEKFGTSMYSGFVLNLAKKVDHFKIAGLDFIFIESLFKNTNWLKKVVRIFQKIINQEISEEKAHQLLKNIDKTLVHSESFLGDVSKLPSFQREENE